MRNTIYKNFKGLAFIFKLANDQNEVEVTVFNMHYDEYDINRYAEKSGIEQTFESSVEVFMNNFINVRLCDEFFMRSLQGRILPILLSNYIVYEYPDLNFDIFSANLKPAVNKDGTLFQFESDFKQPLTNDSKTKLNSISLV